MTGEPQDLGRDEQPGAFGRDEQPSAFGRDEQPSAHEHVAEHAVRGGGQELIGSRSHAYRPHIRHFGRFRWAIAALFLLAVGALAAAVILSASGRSTNASAGVSGDWSTWRPVDSGLAGAQEIADYLAPYYRATPADQLAVVTVVNLNNPAAPTQVVVPTNSTGSVLPLPPSSTVVYNLCGEGSTNCSIGVGAPSANRLLLLRREALELALYTFRYITGTQTVVTILPPGYTVQRSRQKTTTKTLDIALAFDRAELTPWLARPLRSTLPESLPPTVSQMAVAPEAELVSVLTAHGMFSETTAQGQDGSTVITLTGPLQPQ